MIARGAARRLLRPAAPALLVFLLTAACAPGDNDPGPGGVTVGEARALDEAAAMIDERRTPAEVLAEQDRANDAATVDTRGSGKDGE